MAKPMLLPFMYGSILIPGFFHIFLLQNSPYERYVIHILALFTLAVLGRFLKQNVHFTIWCLLLMAASAWLSYTYGGLASLMALSPVFIYSSMPSRFVQVNLFALHFGTVYFAMNSEPLSWRIGILLFLVFMTAILVYFQYVTTQKDVIQQVYDDLRRRHYELNEANRRLLLFSKQVEEAAQAEERTRISRELHDDLGHRLIRAKMMMEAALQVIPGDPDKGMSLLVQIRDQLSTGMDGLRATVRRLKPPSEVTGTQALRIMLEEIGRENGIRTALSVEGQPYPLYPSLEIILYKNARESLTNALKHGRPDVVEIKLSYNENEICMAVSNNGTLPLLHENLNNVTGLGMAGMSERCQVAGGSLEVELEPYFTVTTRLPVSRQGEVL
ncbi:sensor histidine kinase [Paenibacillus lentus]|uniref:histidine kinase n=1 Tax=Paenibacillus lentus TaxID=1338368 RepID=A0A3Q8S3G1_9BACL|nr:sensor histidine kinase [Paenibacillus lentus]AZK45017.1 sensor histidine kinase [Paenibacillus lentus]